MASCAGHKSLQCSSGAPFQGPHPLPPAQSIAKDCILPDAAQTCPSLACLSSECCDQPECMSVLAEDCIREAMVERSTERAP